MSMIVPEVLPVFSDLAAVFTQPTFARFLVLSCSAILTPGRRTVANLLRTAGSLAPGHTTSYQRVLSSACWSPLLLAALLTRFLIRHFASTGIIELVGDDTVEAHKGSQVYGKACHRDPVRSTHSFTAWKYGHKWVVLAVLVQFPFANRPWALPVLVALYRDPKLNEKEGRRHRTPAQRLLGLLRLMRRWFPDRRFRLATDGGYGSHEMARTCKRLKITLVSRCPKSANLFEPPSEYSGRGRPRVKGDKLPSPAEVVTTGTRVRVQVRWYGGGSREVEVVTGTGHWYKAGQGLVEMKWVYVHDLTGTHRDEYFFSTDVGMSAEEIVGCYTGRWSIETTFQECRAYLGLETTRGWCEQTVLRAAPCLFGLYSVVAMSYAQLPAEKQIRAVEWRQKSTTTFADAITVVRRELWQQWIFTQPQHQAAFAQLSGDFRHLLLSALAPAA